MSQHPLIVVGVDGSAQSKGALRWAAGQAELVGADLKVVMCWDFPSFAYWVAIPEGMDLEGDTRKALDDEVAEVLGSKPTVAVSKVVRQGRAASILIEASRGALLLVVGSRGHGEFAGMLLGSVSEHCVTHADCTVVVVR